MLRAAVRACLLPFMALACFGQPAIQTLLNPAMQETWTAPGSFGTILLKTITGPTRSCKESARN